ncbi:AMP-binding protein [Anderseniella sp. Alg231-50]|uniref:AMP-binding protein n=1 Tax=Anderseniella sp. Alg231-50 TaxID=1922226 RepID=UPI000D55CEAB
MTSFSRIHHLLEHQAAHAPDAIALTTAQTGDVTFADWLAAARNLADELRKAGVRPGHRVMLVAENSFSAATGLIAASLLDAWSVPVNARLSATEIDRIRDHAQPAATVFTHTASNAALDHAQTADGHEIKVGAEPAMLAIQPGTAAEPRSEDADQVATLLYTTGTTGDPKGVMLTHANLIYGGQTSASHREITSADYIYAVLPLTHVFGLSSAFMAGLAVGARLELVPRFDAGVTFAALQSRVSIFPAVPQMHALLMAHASQCGLEKLKAERLRYISSGGAPLDLAWKQKVEAFFGLPLFNGYGMTEGTAGIAATRPGATRADTSVGRMLADQEVRIERPGQDGIGEIVIHGPNIMTGYYRNQAATDEVLGRDGWLRTGDLGYLDDQNNLHITGRAKELIIRSGFNVYPLEVEAALNQHPQVVQAAVIGHSANGNEDIVAFIQPLNVSGLVPDQLKDHLKDRLAAYKHPTRWIISDQLPAAPSGKILKARLATVFADELAAVSEG